MGEPKFSVSEFIAVTNQTLEYSQDGGVLVEGEVSGFKVNQGKWVFFDLKDEEGSISCFMPLWQLRIALEDGMKVVVKGSAKVTNWGKFSFTVKNIAPVGEGSIKKSFEKLKKKLEKEGLFDPRKKRPLPEDLAKIGVISSTDAAGYADFCKIINARWGGLDIKVCHTQVQGLAAPDQIIRALKYLNEHGEVQVIAIIRGGGSADDLACFNDEELVRAITSSKIPVITGIGHEVDESLSDLAADIRASTPSNCAEILSKDRVAEISKIEALISHARSSLIQAIDYEREDLANTVTSLGTTFRNRIEVEEHRLAKNIVSMGAVVKKHLDTLSEKIMDNLQKIRREVFAKLDRAESDLAHNLKIIDSLNPDHVLAHGYAILAGKISPGSVVKITTLNKEATAEIKQVKERK